MTSLTSKIDSHDASIKSVIATSNDTLKNAINAKGCVKSIQRGTKVIDKIPIKSSISINISPIDPNKSLLLFDVYPAGPNSTSDNFKYLTADLLQTSIVIRNECTKVDEIGGYIPEFAASYQVVEFY